jgi:hypothetical protein
VLKLKQEAKVKQETESEAVIRDRIVANRKLADTTFLILARDLSGVYRNKLYRFWGYPHFKAYVDQEIQFSYRKAWNLIEINDKTEDLNLDQAAVDIVGWSKMAILAPILTAENADVWLERAKGLPWTKLEAEIKDSRTGIISSPEQKPTTMTFKLDAGDASIIADALEESKRIHETESEVTALLQICGEWTILRNNTPIQATVEDYIAFIAKSFGVNVVVPGGVPKKEVKQEPEEDLVREDMIDDIDDFLESE